MIEIDITTKMKRRAWDRARKMGELKNSITYGAGNIAGFLGEELANSFIKGKIENTYDYDIKWKNIKFEVKTKRCKSKPKPDYDCSVAAYNARQKCDYYVFVRLEYNKVSNRWGKGWLLGFYPKDDYVNDSKYLIKGQIDPSNGFSVLANCYNMKIKDLYQYTKPYRKGQNFFIGEDKYLIQKTSQKFPGCQRLWLDKLRSDGKIDRRVKTVAIENPALPH